MGKEKQETEELRNRLLYKPKLVWDELCEEARTEALRLADRYKSFLSLAKTEREAVSEIVTFAEAAGFAPLDRAGEGVRRFYSVNRGKSVAMAVLGSSPPEAGCRIVASHIDCPRLDLKQNPLYEDLDMAFLKTHYYGGIKKYQWVTRPLALHGKVVLMDGDEVDVCIGEEVGDPVFMVNDLLPHLAQNSQAKKTMPDIVVGEKLNILVGALPHEDQEADQRVKLAVLKWLNERFGLVEADFLSAELEMVPAGAALDVGFDRSMVGGYGHDDRASAFPALIALGELQDPPSACVAFFADKEEVGSEGPTAARSRFFQNFLKGLFQRQGRAEDRGDWQAALLRSKGLSGDVNAAMDPDWPEVYDKRNAGRLGYGVCLSKFTGHRGKVGANDACAEYVGWLRRVFHRGGVVWHAGELGKVDEGGGGTIAKFLAEYGMDVVDIGVPVLSMHSPFEILHKGDLFMAYRAFKSFYSDDSE